jgi:hypothetical protein
LVNLDGMIEVEISETETDKEKGNDMEEVIDTKGKEKMKEIVTDINEEDIDQDHIQIQNHPQKAVIVVMTERKRKIEKEDLEVDFS